MSNKPGLLKKLANNGIVPEILRSNNSRTTRSSTRAIAENNSEKGLTIETSNPEALDQTSYFDSNQTINQTIENQEDFDTDTKSDIIEKDLTDDLSNTSQGTLDEAINIEQEEVDIVLSNTTILEENKQDSQNSIFNRDFTSLKRESIPPVTKVAEEVSTTTMAGSKSKDEIDQLAKDYVDAMKDKDTSKQSEIADNILVKESAALWKAISAIIDADESLKIYKEKIIQAQTSGRSAIPSAPLEPEQKIKVFGQNSPSFSGKPGESFDDWSWKIRQDIRINKMNDQETILALNSKLESTPHTMYKKYIDTKNGNDESYTEFHQKLHKLYGKNARNDDWITKLKTIRRSDFDTLEEFVDRYTDLSFLSLEFRILYNKYLVKNI